MNRDEYVSKAELAREKQRTDRANRGLVSVVQHLMKQLGAAEVRLPIAELDEAHRVSIVADGDTLVVSLRPSDSTIDNPQPRLWNTNNLAQ